MSDAESGGIGPIKSRHEKGESNKGHNKNSNGSCTDRNINWYKIEKFKGKEEGILTLGVKEEKFTYSFIIF